MGYSVSHARNEVQVMPKIMMGLQLGFSAFEFIKGKLLLL